jgi:hypothetical protein
MEPYIAPKAIINVTIDKATTQVSQVQHILGMQSKGFFPPRINNNGVCVEVKTLVPFEVLQDQL